MGLLVVAPCTIRFEQEAQTLGTLEHPAIVPIYESGQWPDVTAAFWLSIPVRMLMPCAMQWL